jgi:chemotaxis protein MotB
MKAGLAVAIVIAVAAAIWAYMARNTLAEKEAELAACEGSCQAAKQDARRLKAREAELVASLKTKEAELRASLEKELANRDVEINQLRGQLSVRVLDRVLFRSGSAKILPAGEKVLAKLAPTLAKGNDRIRVEGHTDNVRIGEALEVMYVSNWELSTARAASVVRYFQRHSKIDPKRLEAVGFGEYKPVVPNTSAENRGRNRRVEIVLSAPPAPQAETKAPAK